jgi:response regulator RpfG family c-di-GMP phosphodiesterase
MAILSNEWVFFAARYALLLFAFVVFGFAFAHFRRAARRDAERLFEQVDIAISRLHVLEESLAEQHAQLEAGLHDVQSQTRIAAAAAPAQRQYETAIRLARAGTTRQELMASCGVTRHEADLLLRLHAPRAPAAAPAAATPPGEARLSAAG